MDAGDLPELVVIVFFEEGDGFTFPPLPSRTPTDETVEGDRVRRENGLEVP